MKVLIVSICFGLPLVFLYAQEEAYVNKTAVYLREKPKGKSLMHLPYGTPLTVIGIHNSWCEVEIHAITIQGFIHESMVSFNSLEKTSADLEKIEAFNLTQSGFEDLFMTYEDFQPDSQYNNEQYKQLNEGLERMLFWRHNEPSSKYYIHNMNMMVERTKNGVYHQTPTKIYNQSKIYNLSPEIYNNEATTKPTYREFQKPQISKSFFDFKPENYLIANVKKKQDSLFLDFPVSTLIHLLRIYFKDDNSFQLYKHHKKYTYTSSKKIRFFSTDENGGYLKENEGQIIYLPGKDNRICLSNFKHPYNPKMKYLFFCDEKIIDKHVANPVTIKTTTQTMEDGFEFVVHELDFDGDGVVDMLRSFEDCPADAGDSNDEVYYFNINGEWKSTLARRYWCIP
nr:hypothetical protein [Allomuricauda sp.]